MKKVATFLLVLFAMCLPDIGGHLNWYAEKQNAGFMPVWCYTTEMKLSVEDDLRHVELTGESKVPYLSDIFPMYVYSFADLEFELDSMMSIGDLILWSGYIGFFLSLFYLLVLLLDDLVTLLCKFRH